MRQITALSELLFLNVTVDLTV